MPLWTERRFYIAWAVILVTFFLMRVFIISIPLERDEGEYAYIAQQMLNGFTPYRDAFDQKPPGIFILYMLALSAFGQSAEGIHLFMYLWNLLSVILLYRLVARFCGKAAGLFSALFLGIMTAEKGVLGGTANTEIFMILPLIGSLLCVTPESERLSPTRIIGAGALMAAAFWIKQVAAMNFLFITIWLIFLHFAERPRRKLGLLIHEVAYLMLGVLLVSAPIFLYIFMAGALNDFLYCVFAYNLNYSVTEIKYPELLLTRFWSSFRVILTGDWLFWLGLAMGLTHLVRTPRLFTFFSGLLVFSFLGVCLAGYFRPHYFVQILPAVAALAGIGFARVFMIIEKAESPSLKWIGYAAVAVTSISIPVTANSDILFSPTPEIASVRLYGPTPFVFSKDMGEFIKSRTNQQDTILVAGTEPQIAFFSRRRNATRYIFFNPLAARYDGVLEHQKRAIDEIRKANPKYIINLLGIYGDTIFNRHSEGYFLRELEKYEREQGFIPREYWVALPESKSDKSGKCYFRFTAGQVKKYENQTGLKLPLNRMTAVLSRE